MDAAGFNVGAKAALGTIKEGIAVGKEAGKLVEDMQVGMHKVVNAQQQQRVQERKKEEQLGSLQEQKAYRQFLDKQKAATAAAALKADIIKTHGKAGWEEYLKEKAIIEKQDLADKDAIVSDRDKLQMLAWWSFGIAAVVAYFLTVY